MSDTAREIAERRLRVWRAQLTRDLYGKRDDIDALEKYVLETLPDVLVEHGNARHKEGQEEMRESAVAKLDELVVTARQTASLGRPALRQARDAIAALPVEKEP